MTAPTFVTSTATSFSTLTNPLTTASIAVQNGDVLVAITMCEAASGASGAANINISTASGSTSAWTLQEDVTFVDANHAYIKAWTATATATGNITVTFTRTDANSFHMGGVVKVWRNSNGIGNVAKNDNNTSSGAPTISITTSGANSGLDFGNADWSATSGTVTFTASNGTPVSDVSDQTLSGGAYCVYSSHVIDAGGIGGKTMGMSAPSTQRYVNVVIEVLGTGSAVTWLPPSDDPSSVIVESFYKETMIGY